MIKWMKSLLILIIIISCRGVDNKISANQEIVTFFSWQPSRFLFLLDSVAIVKPHIIPDSVYFISKSNKEFLNFPKDSIKIIGNGEVNNRIGVLTKSSNRYNYMIMDIPEYNIDEVLNKPEDSLANLLKSYLKDKFKLIIYKDGILYEKELKDTSKIILQPVYWGVD